MRFIKRTLKRRIMIAMIAIGIFFTYEFATLIYTAIDDKETSSKISLTEYNELFYKEAQSKFKILATVESKNRPPVSTYVYDKSYNICVFKVILIKNSPLKNIINYENGTSNQSLNAVYADLPSFNFDMHIKVGRSVNVTNVKFKFHGDSIKLIEKNDSLYCYYFKFKSFSVNYNDEPYDIIANADQSNIPASILFKKKGKVLYLILMSVADEKKEMQPNLLYRITKK